jgi:NAD(P)-dependent dehydrogenase (short-subunit alcohol dehydrogenase family)
MNAPLTIVTGGSRGIGAAVSRRLVADGHDVVIAYRSNSATADAVVNELSSADRTVVAIRADTTDERSVIDLFAAAAEIGTVTGLVNNAGSARAVGTLANNDIETIRADLDVNLLGVLTCCKYAIHAMADHGGAIVNISSAAATIGSPGMYVHYAAAKAAVDTLTVGLSKELAAQNIRVNAVAPGVIETEFHKDRERPRKMASSIPLGRPGVPDEIAGAVSWLLSEDARYATGTVVRVAGGM